MVQNTAKPVNKWMVLISVAMGVFLATIDGSIVNIGLNTLVNDLHQPLAFVEWVVLAYMLTIATLMLTIGRLVGHDRQEETLPGRARYLHGRFGLVRYCFFSLLVDRFSRAAGRGRI